MGASTSHIIKAGRRRWRVVYQAPSFKRGRMVVTGNGEKTVTGQIKVRMERIPWWRFWER